MILGIRILTAAVWFTFGMVFKVFDVIPRHRQIVAAVLGSEMAAPATILVGLAEVTLGLWFLAGFRARTCALLQTIAIIVMNALELTYARSLLLAPVPMVMANAAFLSLVWYAARWTAAHRSPDNLK